MWGKVGKLGGLVKLFNKDGALDKPLKVWTGSVKPSSGKWSVDYSSAGFEKVLSVQVTSEAAGTDRGDANFASVDRGSITNTGCSGLCSNAVSAGLLVGVVMTSSNTMVDVLVIGY